MAERQVLALADQDVERIEGLMARQGVRGARVPGPCWETMSTISVLVETAEHGQSLLKLYRHERKYRREVTAMGRLIESEYTPPLLYHGQLPTPVKVFHRRLEQEVDWSFYILRGWFEGVPGQNPPAEDQDAFLKAIFAFCDHCGLYGLCLGDVRGDSFIWWNRRLTWIDYDGFTTSEDYAESLRTRNRNYLRARLERLEVI